MRGGGGEVIQPGELTAHRGHNGTRKFPVGVSFKKVTTSFERNTESRLFTTSCTLAFAWVTITAVEGLKGSFFSKWRFAPGSSIPPKRIVATAKTLQLTSVQRPEKIHGWESFGFTGVQKLRRIRKYGGLS